MDLQSRFSKSWLADRLHRRQRARRRAVLESALIAVSGFAATAAAYYLVRRGLGQEPLSEDDVRELEAFEAYERSRRK